MKTLLTSHCSNDCAYCAFRSGRKCPREVWEPEELADVTMHLWRERKIMGLFLSSSIMGDPDYITEKQLEVLRILRKTEYPGYIHLRVMPGVSRNYITEAVELADRVGINLDAPNREIFSDLCPDKGGFKEAVLKRLDWIVDEVQRAKPAAAESKFGFGKAGVDTQLIVGAVSDNDWQYIQTTDRLYNKLGLKRVYYSGFEPVHNTPLEKRPACPPSREYRLYQSSFLIRDYGFTVGSFSQIVNDEGFLPNTDPKLVFAKMNPDMFPIDLNTATYYEIVRIPHVGPYTARKIINSRKNAKIRYSSDLEGVLGAGLARRINRYVELKYRKLTDFSQK